MKMTPEQKAFFKYGRAFERACRRAELLRTARKRCAENPGRYGPGMPIAKVLFDRTINKARQKRAVCRGMQTEERNCWTCAFNGTSAYYEPCNKCFRYGSDRQFDNWEPRKEKP